MVPDGYPEYPDPLRGGFLNRGHEALVAFAAADECAVLRQLAL